MVCHLNFKRAWIPYNHLQAYLARIVVELDNVADGKGLVAEGAALRRPSDGQVLFVAAGRLAFAQGGEIVAVATATAILELFALPKTR